MGEFAVFIAMIYEALTQQKTGKRNGQNIFAEIASIFSLIRCNLIAFNQFTTCRKGGGGLVCMLQFAVDLSHTLLR